MNDKYSIAALIRFHRLMEGLTQKELADLAGTGKTVVYDLEKGKMTVQIDTLKKVLDALHISVNFDSPLMEEFYVWYRENTKRS